jgi:hypothetical protein
VAWVAAWVAWAAWVAAVDTAVAAAAAGESGFAAIGETAGMRTGRIVYWDRVLPGFGLRRRSLSVMQPISMA